MKRLQIIQEQKQDFRLYQYLDHKARQAQKLKTYCQFCEKEQIFGWFIQNMFKAKGNKSLTQVKHFDEIIYWKAPRHYYYCPGCKVYYKKRIFEETILKRN